MKTLTELSGTLIRMASAAIEEAKRSLPAEPTPAAPPAPPAETATPVEAAAAVEGEAAAPSAEGSPAPTESGPSDSLKAALQEAVAKATGLSGDRLVFLCAAVEAVGGRVADVRLVRVFGGEEPVSGAKAVGGHQYLVDMMPSTMKQVAGQHEEGGRRGGRGGRGGGGGGRGGGGGGAKAGATGGFSMDSLREDRKNERGRGGGRPLGRGPGGGGRGGGRGGPPPAGGGPKPGP